MVGLKIEKKAIEMDVLRVALFQETTISEYIVPSGKTKMAI